MCCSGILHAGIASCLAKLEFSFLALSGKPLLFWIFVDGEAFVPLVWRVFPSMFERLQVGSSTAWLLTWAKYF